MGFKERENPGFNLTPKNISGFPWQPLGPLLKVKLLVGYSISAGRACCTVTDRRTGVRPAQL